jgi:hypothetical protein
MFKHLGTTVFSIFLLTFFISCQKDIDSSAGLSGGSAVFNLDGAPSGCASATVSGVFAVGNPLSASNTVTIAVDVQAKGTYSFRTNSANGVYFAAAGSFSSTGSQTVVLTGVGTPVATGNFSYATTNKNACSFNVAFVAGSGGGGGGTTAVFTYGGAPGNCTSAVKSGTYMNGIALGAGNTVDISVNVTTIGSYTISTNTASGISFVGVGVFTSTGPNTVRLTGQGTPNTTGAATFTPTGGCSFSVTIAPAPAAGVFTYNCAIPPVVAGIYTAGTALNATNTIIIAVNITTVGSYSVTTGAVNGVTFSGSGVFAATGAQIITLTSTSTPTAAGPFSYTLSGAGGCGFSVTYGTGGGGGGDFLKCTINGTVLNFNDNLAGINTPASPPVPNTLAIQGDITGVPTSLEDITITIQDDTNPITARAYNNRSGTSLNGSLVLYTEPSGAAFWATGFLNPNTLSVVITYIDANYVTGTFSGKIYDMNGVGTNFKTITNGSFRVTF